MNYEPYMNLVALPDLSVFQFISEGTRGRITKQIRFDPLIDPNVYALELGDVNEYKSFDRAIISNNGDKDRILATVIQAIEIYTERYPNRSIRFWSRTIERTRLFRIAIGVNLQQLSASFIIRATSDEDFMPFKKDMDSSKFELKRKRTRSKVVLPKLEMQSRLLKKTISVQLNNKMPVGDSYMNDKDFYCTREIRHTSRIKNPALSGRVGDQAMLCGDEGAV